jgi:hypothetical protein
LFPSAESVDALLAGDPARATSLAAPASHEGRVSWRVEQGANGKLRLQLSSVVVDDHEQVQFKVYPDIEVDLSDPGFAWHEQAGAESGGVATDEASILRAARLPDEEKALRVAHAYSSAWMARDIDRIVSLSHPVLAIRFGGPAKYRKFVADFFEQMKAADFSHGTEAIGTPSDEFIAGPSRMIGVPSVRKLPGTATTPSVYVVVSYDEGRTWSVLSLACTDERWLEALVPGYRGRPDILGLGNPAVREFLGTGSFDEAAFLRGARHAALH